VAFLLVSDPIPIIVHILEVVVLAEPVLLSIHPLAIIDFLLFGLISSRLSKQHSRSMLLALLKLASILEILFTEAIDSISFHPLAPPGAQVHVAIGESILLFDQLRSLIIIDIVQSSMSASIVLLIDGWRCIFFLFLK
jgi:hypothetical protein